MLYKAAVWWWQEKSSGRSARYKLTSTAMLWLQTSKAESGTMNLGGSLTKQVIIIILNVEIMSDTVMNNVAGTLYWFGK